MTQTSPFIPPHALGREDQRYFRPCYPSEQERVVGIVLSKIPAVLPDISPDLKSGKCAKVRAAR